VINFERIDLKCSFSGDFEPIDGFSFRWSYSNPAALKYATFSRALISVFMFYVFVNYVANCIPASFTQFFAALITGIGVFPSNPIFLFLPQSSPTWLFNSTVMAGYVALFRMFGLLQIELVRSRKDRPALPVLIVVGLFFACYAGVDAVVCHDRLLLLTDHDVDRPALFEMENILANFHFAYTAGLILFTLAAFWSSTGYATKRLVALVLLQFVALVATIFVQIICIDRGFLGNSIMPSMLFTAIHSLTGGVMVFMMQSNRGRDYRFLGKPMVDVSDPGLDVEKASSGEEDEGFTNSDA
jgi:hypothetical protein